MAYATADQEKAFLANMAVSAFNDQYNQTLDPANFTIKSLLPNYGCDYGYEFESKTDILRLRMYFNLGDLDFFLPYRLEVDTTYRPDMLGDEVYVMLGTVQRYYKEGGIYRFRTYSLAPELIPAIDDMYGVNLQFMTGETMQYVA